MMVSSYPPPNADGAERASHVLTVAFLRASDSLGLIAKDMGALLGVSAASVSRLMRGDRKIEADSKEGELAILFVRLFRSLDTLVGGNAEKAQAWFRAKNHHLQGVPAELVQSVSGLVYVIQYLDAMRGNL